jgi:hypothetical protein
MVEQVVVGIAQQGQAGRSDFAWRRAVYRQQRAARRCSAGATVATARPESRRAGGDRRALNGWRLVNWLPQGCRW